MKKSKKSSFGVFRGFKTATIESEITCSHCGKNFKTKYTLNALDNINTITGLFPKIRVLCPYCGTVHKIGTSDTSIK